MGIGVDEDGKKGEVDEGHATRKQCAGGEIK